VNSANLVTSSQLIFCHQRFGETVSKLTCTGNDADCLSHVLSAQLPQIDRL